MPLKRSFGLLLLLGSGSGRVREMVIVVAAAAAVIIIVIKVDKFSIYMTHRPTGQPNPKKCFG